MDNLDKRHQEMITKLNDAWIRGKEKPERSEVEQLEKELYQAGEATLSGYLRQKKILVLGWN